MSIATGSHATESRVPPNITPSVEPKLPKSAFRPDIEGLRAIAVGLVVLGHAGFPYLDGGYVGVDVFFVISGFLITSLLLRELADTGRISVAGFYARRATRLLPMAATVIVATLAASWLWLAPTRFQAIVGDALSSSLYFVNYRLAFEGTQYLNADEAPSPFQHFWSLAVEEQFYLIWPLLLMAVALILRDRRELIRDGLAVVLIVITGATFAAGAVLTEADPVWSYFGLHTRGWELAIGALVAVAAGVLVKTPRTIAALLMWGGLAAIVWAAFNYGDATIFPGIAAAVPVLGTAAVIAGGCAAPRLGAGGMLSLPAFQVLGKLSYGLYLWHWPVLMIGPAALDMQPTVRLNLVLAAAALGITAVTYEVVENPVRFAKFLKRRPRRGIGLGAALTACTAALALTAGALLAPQNLGDGEPVATPEVDTVEELNDLIRESAAYHGTPSNLTPPLEAADDLAEIYENGCNTYMRDTEVKACKFGEVGADTKAVLFGDSHAASWFPALNLLAEDNDWELTLHTKSACPAPMVAKNVSDLGGRYHECDQWRDDAIDRILAQKPDLIVVGTSESNNPVTPEGGDSEQVWLDGWRETLELLAGSGARIVLPSNPPKFESSVPDCVSANLDDPSVCGGAASELIVNRGREQRVLEMAESLGVHTIDTEDWFCADDFCPVIVGSMLAFRDSHHFNTTYSEYLAPVLAAELPEIE
ncbi:acyltransferase family protein [Glycomyces xiaoerkulensis]|uniref:acyltransferase family protein n=1 Tax=Glycomyces xiaoerkulensis TaxID=2038139 RepID=UPI000C263BC6|nr:acyltransferase family protein [Glycomyces xiaoerkulensis]